MNQTPLLPPPGSHFISLNQGIAMTSLYRTQKETILAPPFQNQDILPICETFNRSDVDTLLAKQGCDALRIYFGMDELLKVRVVIVGVNADAEDILPPQLPIGPFMDTAGETNDEDDILEEGHRCPPACPPPSPLNT